MGISIESFEGLVVHWVLCGTCSCPVSLSSLLNHVIVASMNDPSRVVSWLGIIQ